MKKIIFTTLAFSAILTSCGPNNTISNNDKYETKIVLSAFNDLVSKPSLDESLLSDLPKLVDLSEDMTPVKNQADRGTCTVFSTIGLVEATIKKDLGVEVNLSEEYMNFSSKNQGLYQTTEGSVISINTKSINLDGLLLEEDWSYQASWFRRGFPCASYKSTDKSAPAICFSHNKPNTLALSRKIDAKNINFSVINKNTNEIIKFLAIKKRPLIMSVNVNFNGWSKTGETNYNETLRQECIAGTANCGGHSILLTGYDMEKREFMFKNSWGKKWGKNGYGTIPFDVVDKYTSEILWNAKILGEVQIPSSRNSALNLQKFNSSGTLKKGKSIKVKLDGDISETSGKMFYITSFLVKKHVRFSKDQPVELNTEIINLYDLEEQKTFGDEIVRVTTHTIPNEENSIIFESLNDSKLIIPSKSLTIPTIDVLIESTYYDLALRTTLYVHGDEDGFVVVDRLYSPLSIK